MIKTIPIAVDIGNQNCKTVHFLFTSGLAVSDKKPARGEKYICYKGKYYTLSENRIPYRRDKTADPRFFILTLFAILMEVERSGQANTQDIVQVQLPVGLPPRHFAELYEKYELFFKGDGEVMEIMYNDRKYQICIQEVMAFPQDYAALMTRYKEIAGLPRTVGIDIGGFTTDYILMRFGKQDMDYCDSMEIGIIKMYNRIQEQVNAEYDMLLDEMDVNNIIQGKTEYYQGEIVDLVERQVEDYVFDLLASIRERGIDTKSALTIFIGGGSLRLRRFIEKSERLEKYMFIDDIRANAKGFDLLYKLVKEEQGSDGVG